MSDGEYIAKLMAIGADSNLLQTAQHVAAKKLLDYDGEVYPQDGCAITLSVLLQEAGIAVPDIRISDTPVDLAGKRPRSFFCVQQTAPLRRWRS